MKEKSLSAQCLKARERRARMNLQDYQAENEKYTKKRREKIEKLKKHSRLWKAEKNKKSDANKKAYAARKAKSSSSLPFANKNVFGKHIGKLNKSLEGTSREQQIGILSSSLAARNSESNDIKIILNATKKPLPSEAVAKVRAFYLSDQVTQPDPSMYGTVFTKNQAGEKIRVSIRHMRKPYAETHKDFLVANPDVQIGLAKFFNLGPKNIRSFIDTPHRTCKCKYHENVLALLSSLKTCIPQKSLNEFIEFIVCDENSFECMSGTCDDCSDFIDTVLQQITTELKTKEIKWCEWTRKSLCRSTRLSQEPSKMLVWSCASKWKSSSNSTVMWKERKRRHFATTNGNQTQRKRSCKSILPSLTAVRRKTKSKPTILARKQSHCLLLWPQPARKLSRWHLSAKRISTAGKVSDYLKVIVEHLKKPENLPNLNRLKIVSDGSGAQFKNK